MAVPLLVEVEDVSVEVFVVEELELEVDEVFVLVVLDMVVEAVPGMHCEYPR